jgi:hypothetical protein
VSAVSAVCSRANRSIRVRGTPTAYATAYGEIQGAHEFLAQNLAGVNRGELLGHGGIAFQ